MPAGPPGPLASEPVEQRRPVSPTRTEQKQGTGERILAQPVWEAPGGALMSGLRFLLHPACAVHGTNCVIGETHACLVHGQVGMGRACGQQAVDVLLEQRM